MRNAFSRIKFSQACINLGEKYKSLDSVVIGRIRWQILQGVQNAVSYGFQMTCSDYTFPYRDLNRQRRPSNRVRG